MNSTVNNFCDSNSKFHGHKITLVNRQCMQIPKENIIQGCTKVLVGFTENENVKKIYGIL